MVQASLLPRTQTEYVQRPVVRKPNAADALKAPGHWPFTVRADGRANANASTVSIARMVYAGDAFESSGSFVT